MNKLLQLTNYLIFILFGIILVLSSCKNDINEVAEVTRLDSLPIQSAFNIETLYSERGIVRYKVISPRVDQYEANEPYVEFPEGMQIFFYDSLGNIRSELTAGYGIKKEKERMMEAKHNVIVISHGKEQTINTEHLIWDQNDKKIFTNEFVTITTKDKVIYGDALVSDEKFERWEITNSKGNIRVKDNEDL